MAAEDYKMPKLNGENYHTWAIRARAILVQKKCWEAVEPGYGAEMSEAQTKKNDEAITLLFLIVEDSFLDDIGDCIRARDAWNQLKEMHTKFGLLHILQLMKDFFNIQMKQGEKIQSYLGRLMEIHRKLASGGYSFTDREVALVMLIGLPKSYETLILNLEKDEQNLSTAIVKSRLLVEEKRLSRGNSIMPESNQEHALHTKNYQSQKKIPNERSARRWPTKRNEEQSDSSRRNTKCFSCGGWGHIARNCKEAHQKDYSAAKTAVDIQTNLALLTKVDKSSSLWILDSGATEHMTSRNDKFTHLNPYLSSVEVANSEKVQVTGIGNISLSAKECKCNITLEDVLYVPNLGGNLLSIGRIEEKGFKIEFSHGEAKIVNSNNEVVLTAKKRGRLYIIEEEEPSANVATTVKDDLWHRRLGHRHHENKLCPTCIQGKMKRKKFPKVSNSRAHEVLEIIHSDVAGKITPSSIGGSNYFVTFTDDFTRYTKVYTMKTKDQVLEKFDEYRRVVENFHNRKIKFLRSDNGGEYKSEEFKKYLIRHGIQRQLSVPESPQQNGLSERMNQSLLNITRCLLIESGADPSFWAEAMSTAAHVINKCPSTAINGIPEEMWLNKPVKIEHLKVFGCRAWSHVRSYPRRGKLDPRAKEYVFVGYPDGVKGYKLWDPENKNFFISRDTIFEEDIFPFKSTKTFNEEGSVAEVMLHVENEINYDPTPENKDNETNEQKEDITASEELQIEHDIFPSCISRESTQEAVEEVQVTNITEPINDPVTPTNDILTSRQQRTTRPPKHLDDYLLYNASQTEFIEEGTTSNKDPLSVKEALNSPEANMWHKAMQEEIGNLKRARTWELVTRPPNTKVITSRWLFCRKKCDTGNGIKYKARLVARGYLQKPGIHFQETFAPVIKLKSIRILIALAVELDFDIHQMDITAAYLNGTLDEDVYMAQPEGCIEEGQEHLVCHLKRSLYGLRQSGRVWNNCLDSFFLECEMKRAKADPCIYYSPSGNLIVGVYVDDLLIVGRPQDIEDMKIKIKDRFVAKDLGPASQILSIKITKEEGSFTLDQTEYITEILENFKMMDARPAATPLDPNMKYQKVDDHEWEQIKDKSSEIPFRQAVGSLLYLACGTRPDLAYASTYMSQFNDKHSEEHWRGVKHIFRYLKGTCNKKLRYKKTGKGLSVFCDADWAGDVTDRKSYSGYVIMLGNAPVSWSSKKQATTALSSTEAEYIAMCNVSKEVLWINNLFTEICDTFVKSPQKVLVDNQGAMFLANNFVTSERSKHIALKYYFLRELVSEKIIEFAHVPSNKNIADLFTKSVTKNVLRTLNYGLSDNFEL